MLFRHTALYFPAQVIGPLAQVCAALVWTHWLAPAPYGLLTFVIASQDLLFLICMSWWTHYTMRYLGSLSDSRLTSFLRAETPVFLLTFILQIVGLFVVLGLLRQPVTAVQIVAALAYTGTKTVLNHLGERARAQSRIGIYTLGQFFSSIIGFAIAYAAVACLAPTVEAVLFGFALAQLIGVIIIYVRLGIVRGDVLPQASVIRAALSYGAPLILAGAFAWLAPNGIRIVIEWTDGAEALGLLAVGWGLGMRLSATIAMLVITASFPLAVQSLRRGSRDEAYAHLSRGGTLLCGLIVPASIGICFLVVPFITMAVAEPFRAATIQILPYAAATGAIRNVRMHIADPVFLLIERPKLSTIVNLIDASLVMVGCLGGAWFGGLMGATIACLVATAISTVIGFLLAYRIANFHVDYEDCGRIVVASAAMAIVLAAIPWSTVIASNLPRLLVEAGVGATVYGLAIAALFPHRVQFLRKRVSVALQAYR